MTSTTSVRPTTNGRVIGLGLGKFRFVSGSGVALVLSAMLPAAALAGPEGANVAAGNATIRQNGNTTIIRAGDRTIIDYTRFNIGANETVRFVQPNANARVLNRIKGDAPTTIDGTLKANGIVYFANRAGVIFGPTAIVNVGGIYAAAGNISNSDFQAGLNRFTDVTGSVTNAGQIDARFAAALVGKNVVNTGALATRGGVIAMVAGDEVTLSERGGVMSVRINTAPTEAGTPGTKTGVGVDNSGTISAPKGRALMVAGDMYSLAVRNTGNVTARNIKIEGQGDANVQVSGTLDASNTRGLGNSKGGSIEVTAKNVTLENATVNADGRRGGGEVLIGGDYQGNGTLRNATNTTVDADSTISANATQKGDGGTIVVWSDSTTNFLGQASANGGRRGGDGGLIETSGKINLNVVGAKVEAKAGRNGQGGLWLLDPVNVNIDDPTGGDDTAGGSITGGIFDPDNSVSPAIVDATVLRTALEGGTSVTIITGSVGTDQGNISVNTALNLTLPSTVTLTLRAANDINVNSGITATGAGALNLNLFANADGSGNIDTNLSSGNVFIGSAIQLNGGNFSTSGVNYTQSFNVSTNGGNASILNTGAVSITQALDTGGGATSVTLQGSGVAISGSVIAGSGGVTLRPANDAAIIRINNGSGDFEVTSATLANISAPAGATLTIGSATGTGNILIGSGGATNLSAGNLNLALRGGAITFNNAITLNTAHTLTLTGTSVADNTGTTDITASTLALNISGATSIDSAVANLSSSGSGSLDINNTGNLTVGAISASSITITNAGTLSFAALTTTAGNLNIDSTAQVDFTSINVTGNIDIRTGGALTATGAVNVTGSSTFVTRLDGGANISLTDNNNTFGSTLTLRSRNTAASADAAGSIIVGADSAVQLGQVATTGFFSLNAAGNITANSTVAANSVDLNTQNVSNGSITLAQLQASGSVRVNTLGTGGNVTLTNNQTLTIDGTSAVGGNLSLTTSAGNISVPALNVGGTTVSFTTQGTDDDITVGTLTGPTIFNVNTTGSGGNATIAGAGNMTINAAVAGTLSFTSGGTTGIVASAPLTLGASTSANALTVTAPDLSVVGTVTVTTGDVTLQPDNDADTIGINSVGQDFTLSSADLLNIASSGRVTIGRSTGTGLISLGGAGAVNLAATNYDLTLRGGAMTFANALTLNNAKNLTLNVTSVADSNVGTDFTSSAGSLTLNTTGAASLDASFATLNASNVGGALDLANTGNLSVAALTSGGLTLDTTGTINFTGNTNVTGNLDVRSGGLISSTNQFTVSGTSAFVSRLDGGAAITLTNTANNFGTSLSVRSRNTANSADAAGNITVVSAGPLALSQVATTSTFDVTAGGAITSTGTVRTGAANLSTGTTGGSITLNQLQSAGTVTVTTSGNGDVTLTNNQALTLGNTSTVGRNLSLTTTSGNLNVPNLTVNGTVALATQGSGDDISAGNFTGATSFNIVTTGAGGDATFGSTGGISAAVNIGGQLNFTASTFAQIASVGNLTVGTGSAGTAIQITAPDLSIATSLMAGGNILLQPDNDTDTVSLNNTGGDFSLSAADLANISTTGTVTIGRAAGTGNINLGSLGDINLAMTNYDLLIRGGLLTFNGGLTLSNDRLLELNTAGILSPNAGTDVTIGGSNGRLRILSNNGATLSGSVATIAAAVSGGSLTYAGTGPLTVGTVGGTTGVAVTGGGDATINSVGDLIIANSISAAGSGNVTINAGTGAVTIQSGSTITSGLGVVSVTASGDISAPADTSTHISGTTINLTSNTGTIGAGNTLRTQSLALSASGDTGVNIAHTGSVDATLNAASGIVTFASTGAINTGGNWTAQGFQINAGGNISLAHNVSATAGSATFAASGGAFSITTGDTLSVAGGNLNIRATDVAIDGTISNAAGSVFITRDTLGTIGVGEGTGDMLITKAELANITALLLGIGDTNTTRINVRNVQLADLTGITEIGFNAGADTGDVSFAGPAQVFRAMFAQADDSIIVDSDISATQGNLSLTANTDAMMDADNDRISIANNVTISTASPTGGSVSLIAAGIVGAGSFVINSNAGLTINSPISAVNTLNLIARGGIVINAPGSGQTINISANDGVTISDDLTNNAGPTVINADADNNGNGTFTLAAGKTLNTTNNNLSVTAADVVLDGTINAGTATVSFTRSTAGTIGLGLGVGDLQISNAELSRITAGTLSLGSELISSINVDSVVAMDTANISALFILLAGDVSILNSFNTSNASLAIARALDGSIGLGQAAGDMTISNAELLAITTNNLQIGGGGTRNITVNGVQLSDLAGATGNINLISGQTLTFQSNASTFLNLTATAVDGIIVNTNLSTSAGDLNLNGDTNNAANTQDGISIASGRTISASGGNLILRSQTGAISGSGSATLESDGNVDLRDDLTTSGTTTIRADKNADGTGNLILASGRTINASGSDISISAADAILDGNINAGAGSLTITRSAAGTIGVGSATGDLTISGAELGRIIATDLTIGSSLVTQLTVNNVTAVNSNAIAGTTNLVARQITFNGTGSTFNQLDARASEGMVVDVDLLTDLGNMRLDGNSDAMGNEFIRLGGNLAAAIPPASGGNITSPFNITLASDVQLSAATINFTGRDFNFLGKVDSAGSTARSLNLVSFGGGLTTFRGDVGTTGRLFTITTNQDGATRLFGRIQTNGTITFNDSVRIIEDTIIDVAGGGGVLFNSFVATGADAAAERSLTVLTARSTNEGAINFPLISFARNVGQSRALSNLFLNFTPSANGRANVPGVATIIFRNRAADGTIVRTPNPLPDFIINLTGTFRMGQNEKLTAGGGLSITAPTAAFLGDIVTLRSLRVNSPAITLNRRVGGRLLGDQGGFGTDVGLDFVSGGVIDFSSVPVAVGTGRNPTFGTTDGGGDVRGTLGTFLFQSFGDILPTLINSSGATLRTLDLKSEGPTNTNIATTIAGAIPRESRTNDVGQDTTVSQALFEEIKQLGINPRNPTSGELLDQLSGSATFDDFPRRSPPTAEDFTTVVNRLPADRVTDLLMTYDNVMRKPLLDEGGKPVLDENGKAQRADRRKEILDTLNASVRRYLESTGAKGDVDPAQFRAFLESDAKEAQSLEFVQQFEVLLNKLDQIGLTSREIIQAKASMLRAVRPRGFRTIEQFETMIRANSTKTARASR